MPADSASAELAPSGQVPNASPVPPRTSRVVALLFVIFLALFIEIALTATAAPVNAATPHSLRAVLGEGCGGG